MSAEYSVEEVRARFEAWRESTEQDVSFAHDAARHAYQAAIKALMAYRCTRTVDEDGEPLPLVDALSPGECGTIQHGLEEIEYLAEYLAYELPTPPARTDEGAVPIRQYRNVCKCPPDDPFCICNTRWQDVSEGYFNLYSTTDESREWRTLFARPPARAAQVEGSVSPVMQQADAVSPALIKPTAEPVAQVDDAITDYYTGRNRGGWAAPRNKTASEEAAEPVAQGEAVDIRSAFLRMLERGNHRTDGDMAKLLDRLEHMVRGDQDCIAAQRMLISDLKAARPRAVPDARIIDLAERLVASGPKAAHVSASECHEISDFILSLAAAPSPGESE